MNDQPKDYAIDNSIDNESVGHGSGIGFIVVMAFIFCSLALAAWFAW